MLFFKVSLLSLVSYLVLGYLVKGIVQNKFKKEEQNTEEKSCVVGTIRILGDLLINFEEMIKKAYSFEDMMYTLRFAGFFYALTLLSSVFSTLFIVMIIVNLSFLHRPVYKMQQAKIDGAFSTVSALWEKYSKMVVNAIPKYVEAVKKN